MRAQRTFVVIVALLGAMAGTALADTPVKIAVVDVLAAFDSVPDAMAAKARLQAARNVKQADLDTLQNDVKARKALVDRALKHSSPEAVMKTETYETYQRHLRKLEEAYDDLQKELKELEARLSKPILEKIVGTVKKIAEEDGYSIVLEKSEARVVYVVPAIDITDKVIKRYGE